MTPAGAHDRPLDVILDRSSIAMGHRDCILDHRLRDPRLPIESKEKGLKTAGINCTFPAG